jgi:hypothetical protein
MPAISTVVAIALGALFLFALAIRWASKSLPRALIFIALLVCSPYLLGFSLLSVVAFLEAATQQDHPVRAKGSKL